ncbi:hypothetical protein D3C73_1425260 [compost metagenome]
MLARPSDRHFETVQGAHVGLPGPHEFGATELASLDGSDLKVDVEQGEPRALCAQSRGQYPAQSAGRACD